ncbi:MAG: hypothetical protein ACKOED_06130 [Aestuariivirga sp.]|uniref:hypothetical protein n=1 Tax=Aestuariivirga sp. TaxID=2650926 RepID=UPI0038D1E4E1
MQGKLPHRETCDECRGGAESSCRHALKPTGRERAYSLALNLNAQSRFSCAMGCNPNAGKDAVAGRHGGGFLLDIPKSLCACMEALQVPVWNIRRLPPRPWPYLTLPDKAEGPPQTLFGLKHTGGWKKLPAAGETGARRGLAICALPKNFASG